MGRIDGDVATNGTFEAGAAENRTIEEWRRYCVMLQDRVALLEAQVKASRDYAINCDRDTRRIDIECERLRQENERLKAQSDDATAGENEALRIIIRHLAKLL